MVLAVNVAVGGHFHPQLAEVAVGIGQHTVNFWQGGQGAFDFALVQNVHDETDQQGLTGFLPVAFQALAVRVNDQGCKVLHVPYFVLCANADFIQRIPTHTAVAGCRLEAQHLVVCVLLPPARR
ncbi:hypothetical protein D3C85_1338920 [compost metagenome]